MLAATAVAVRPLSFLYPLGSLSVGSAASTSRRVLFSSSARTHYAPPPPQGEAAVVHPVREPPNPLPPPQKAYLSEEQRSQQGQFEDMRRSGRVPAAPRPAGGSTAASTQSQTQTQAAGSTSSSAKTTTAGAHNEACATLSPSSPSAPRSQKSAKPAEARAAESKTAASMPTASATETVKKASPARKAGGGGKVFRPKKAALSLVSSGTKRSAGLFGFFQQARDLWLGSLAPSQTRARLALLTFADN